jgi:spore coat protein U-like protein
MLALSACVLALAAGEPAMANSSCARFTASDIDVTYDPLGAQGTNQIVRPLSLRVARNSGSGSSTVIAQFVDWDSNATLRIGSRGPIYTIEGNNTVVTNRYNAALLPNQYFAHTFQSKKSDMYESVNGLQFFIDPGQDIPAGVYDETLNVQYRCLNGSLFDHSTDWQSGVLHVSVNVPSKLVANLSGGSTSGTLDFGDFNDHVRGAMVNVNSTGPFTVSIDSDNYGHMVLDGMAHPGHDARIDYGLSFNGFPTRLGSQMHFFRTGIGGAGFPLVVYTNDLLGKRAGTYRDTLTVTVTPTAF